MRIELKWVLIGIGWLIFAGIVAAFAFLGDAGFVDYRVYYEGAEIIREGEVLYFGQDGLYYLYPPLFAQTLVPFVSALAFDSSTYVWFAILFALLVYSTWLVVHRSNPKDAKLMWIIPIVFLPIIDAFYVGQVSIIILALLATTWALMKRGNPSWAALALALAVWIKVYPVLIALYFLWKRRWDVVIPTIGFGIVLLLIQLIISGPGLMTAFIENTLVFANEGQTATAHKNSTVLGFTARLFQDNPGVQPLVVSDVLFALTRWGLVLALSAMTLLLPRSQNADVRFDMEYAAVIVLSLVFAPTLWLAGSAPLVLTILLIVRASSHMVEARQVRRIVAISLVMSMVYFFFLLGYSLEVGAPTWIMSLGFVAYMLLWATAILPVSLLQDSEEEAVTVA